MGCLWGVCTVFVRCRRAVQLFFQISLLVRCSGMSQASSTSCVNANMLCEPSTLTGYVAVSIPYQHATSTNSSTFHITVRMLCQHGIATRYVTGNMLRQHGIETCYVNMLTSIYHVSMFNNYAQSTFFFSMVGKHALTIHNIKMPCQHATSP